MTSIIICPLIAVKSDCILSDRGFYLCASSVDDGCQGLKGKASARQTAI